VVEGESFVSRASTVGESIVTDLKFVARYHENTTPPRSVVVEISLAGAVGLYPTWLRLPGPAMLLKSGQRRM
jgi:hypothetical protein